MSELQNNRQEIHSVEPAFKSVFTKEYWGETSSEQPPRHHNHRIDRAMNHQMKELTEAASASLFEDQFRKVAPLGTLIDDSASNIYSQPGVVLLVDFEKSMKVSLKLGRALMDRSRRISRIRKSQTSIYSDNPQYHLEAPPALLFRENSIIQDRGDGDSLITVYPYNKELYDEETERLYYRRILLQAFGYNKDGNPTSKIIYRWGDPKTSKIIGRQDLDDDIKLSNMYPCTWAVGDSYSYPNSRIENMVRLRSAEICLAGAIESARVKKRARPSFSIGRVAIDHGF